MKKSILFLVMLGLLAAQWIFLTSETKGVLTVHRSGGAGAVLGLDRTGSPLSGGVTCSACHSGGTGTTTISVQVLNGATPITQYTPGQTYTITATVINANQPEFGFQLVALKSGNAQAGNFGAPSTMNSQITTISTRQYFEHNGASSTGVFTTTWTAPASGFGNVTFYAVGNGVDGTGSQTGDKVSSPITLTLTELVATTINYTNTAYCANASDPTPSISGTTGGVFSSTAGLVLNPTTGTIDLSASTPGTYVVTYTHANGTATDNIIVRPSYTVSNSATICSNDSIFLAGAWRKTPGTYVSNLHTTFGCDSIVTTSLSVNLAHNITTDTSICFGDSLLFEGTWYKTAGNYSASYTNSFGCDSIRSLNLGVITLDLSVAISGTSLTSNQSGAQYEWINCTTNQPVPNETGVSFTPSASGVYAVVVTNGTCSDTSACFNFSGAGLGEWTSSFYTLVDDEQGNRFILNFPNQAMNWVEVFDTQGRRVFNQQTDATSIVIPKMNKHAVYAICIHTKGEVYVVKVIM